MTTPLMVCHKCFVVLPVAVRFCTHCSHPTPRTLRKWGSDGQRAEHSDYSIDLSRIIEALCNGQEIPVPKTTARYHYDMAVRSREVD